MLHALVPINPVTVFIGIFLLSIILYTLKELVKYAQVFWSKGHNKQTWQFRKTHPQLRVLQKEVKAHMSFFDQLDQCLQKQQQTNQSTPEGTLSLSQEPMDPTIAAQASTSKTTTHKQTDLITVEPRTKTAKHTFVRKYPKTVMAHPPEGEQEIYPTSEEIMSVTDYMKAV